MPIENSLYIVEDTLDPDRIYHNFMVTIKKDIAERLKDREISSQEYQTLIEKIRERATEKLILLGKKLHSHIGFARNNTHKRTAILEYLALDKRRICIVRSDQIKLIAGKNISGLRYQSYEIRNEDEKDVFIRIFEGYLAHVLK
ncbi:MAG: hypothetical protein AABX16_00740 [Nanoarchaeota archaeon]